MSSEEVANNPAFYVFTTLIWIRTSNNGYMHLEHQHASSHTDESLQALPQENKPDLGLLPLHRDRLAAAAQSVHWTKLQRELNTSQGLNRLRENIFTHLDTLLDLEDGMTEERKLRILITKDHTIKMDSSIMSTFHSLSAPIKSFMPASLDKMKDWTELCQVYIDTVPTQPSQFTINKTSQRTHYDAARERAGITKLAPTEKEVLLYNPDGQIMEASLCTVYFYRDGRWITPKDSTGCTNGVTRRLALARGLCSPYSIERTELIDGESVWLSNAARGFFVGRIDLRHR